MILLEKKSRKAQVSLEYLILITAFFSSLAILIPSINFVATNFFSANDFMMLKQISETLNEQEQLFEFLADGSRKKFEFAPAREITINLNKNQLELSTGSKKITNNLSYSQENFEKTFETKFFMIIEKQNNMTKIFFE